MNGRSVPSLPCLCASFRRTARALTQRYNEAFRPIGLRSTQFTVLQTLTLAGAVTQKQLGRILAMDSTTLTRTLEILDGNGWVDRKRGEDRREWRISLTAGGKAQFEHAMPLWLEAQEKLRSQLGEARWNDLMKLTNEVTAAIGGEGDMQ